MKRLILFAMMALIPADKTVSSPSSTAFFQNQSQLYSVFHSQQDPADQRSTRILYTEHTLKFGGAEEGVRELLNSDLGYSVVFYRTNDGVGVRGLPLFFPKTSAKPVSTSVLGDFRCTASRFANTTNVFCREIKDGNLFHSTIIGTAIVELELKCMRLPSQICHYKLIKGIGIIPSNIQ